MSAELRTENQIENIPLVREFLADHQEMSKLLLQTLLSLEEGDTETAIATARALNRVAGPHIEYEESELYPRISGDKLVSETTQRMYEEHREALLALQKLLENGEPQGEAREEIIDGLRTGVHHAEHCGSLVSLLAALPLPEQTTSLRKLLELREAGRLWTDRIR